MKKSSQTTVHTHIGHERSLCGRNPNRDESTVLSFSEFFSSPKKDQCKRCIYLLKLRGYEIESLRDKFQAVQIHAKQLQSMQPEIRA